MRLSPVGPFAGALFALSIGCTSRPSAQSGTTMEDSVRMILAAYEHDQISLDSATRRLADVLEPVGGLMTSGSISPKAREALEAASRELERRAARRP